MKTMLRNLARRWANRTLARSNDTLRRELIKAEAAAERHEQTATGATKACNDASRKLLQAQAFIDELRADVRRRDEQIERQADLFEELRGERDSANVANGNLSTYNAELARLLNEAINRLEAERRRVVELEEALVAHSPGRVSLDQVWADAAGVAGPETSRP